MNNKQIFYIRVVTSFNNEGDLLINRALINSFSDYGDIVIDETASPQFFLRNLISNIKNCRCEPNFYWALTKSIFSRNEVYLLTIPGHFFGVGLKKALTMLLTGMFFYVLKILGVKIVKVGGCVGPFDMPVKWAEKFRSGAFSFYGLRDSISINNIGLSNSKNAFPDMAFLSQDINAIETQANDREGIVISFRCETHAMAKTDGYQDLILGKLKVLLSSYKESQTIIFCYQVPSDKSFNQQLFEYFSNAGFNCVFKQEKLALKEALVTYSRATLVLSNRLHILLPCIGLGTPHIGIIDKSNHHKILGIYRDIGLEQLLVDVNQNIVPQLPHELNLLFDYEKLVGIFTEQHDAAKLKITAIVDRVCVVK